MNRTKHRKTVWRHSSSRWNAKMTAGSAMYTCHRRSGRSLPRCQHSAYRQCISAGRGVQLRGTSADPYFRCVRRHLPGRKDSAFERNISVSGQRPRILHRTQRQRFGADSRREQEAIIDRSVWDCVKEIQRSIEPQSEHSRRQETIAPLKSVLKCCHCGELGSNGYFDQSERSVIVLTCCFVLLY